MNENKILNGVYYSFEKLDEYRKLQNFVSTKNTNLNSILNNLKISGKDCVYAEQVHGSKIAKVDKKDGGKTLMDVDVLTTKVPNLCLIIRTADCLPLILFDPNKKILTVIHAGWRGSLKNVSGKTVQSMVDIFKVNPKDIVVGIGPSIGFKDYLIKSDVASKFIKKGYPDFLNKVASDSWKLDLLGINILQLSKMSVKMGNIECSDASTFRSGKFYSFRRGDSGQFVTGGIIRE